MPIRTALLLAAGALTAVVLAGCGDTETNDTARTTTSSSTSTTEPDDTTPDEGVDDACIDTIAEYFNNDLDLTRLADPDYVNVVTADLGECDPAGLSSEQAAAVSTKLDPDVIAAISGGAPVEDPAATTTPSSTP